jgi:hypothetical protein
VTTRSPTDVASTQTVRENEKPDHVGTTTRRRRVPFASIPVGLRFPALVVLAVVVLGSLELSGSSASLYAEPGQDSDLVAGRARRHRTDEWWVRTPLVARQKTLGFPDRDELGVGDHDMGVLSDLPSKGWEVVARPHTFPYHVFGIERAFAFEWWIMFFALPALGLYALALQVGLRAVTSALLALLVVFCPFVQWWTGSWTGTSIGYACLAGAALIAAARTRTLPARLGLGALAGWAGACLVIVLYPPTVISMALLVGVVTAAAIATSIPPREGRREWLQRLAMVLGVACLLVGALVVAFWAAHRGGIEAVNDSLYPGQRRNSAGTGDLGILLAAPFDIIESTRSTPELTVNGTNQSEAAAGLFTVLAVAAALFVDRQRSPWSPWRSRVVLLGLLGVSGLLLAWYYLPIPDFVGRGTTFDRVRPDRLLMPFAVASALLLGLFLDASHRSERKLRPLPLAAGITAFAVPTLWAGFSLRIDGEPASRWQVLLLAAVCTIGIGLALRGAQLGLWLLVAFFAVSAATVNPVQHGLDALLDHPAAQLGRELRTRPGAGAVLNFWGGDLTARGGLTASGVDLVSGVNIHPNEKAWRVLDPDDSEREAWDRYNNAVWSPAPPGAEPHIEGSGDTVAVVVDPCDPRLARLGVGTVVTVEPLSASCLIETDHVVTEDRPTLYAYRIDRSP